LAFGALFAAGCSMTTDTPQGETGSLSLDLVIADGIVIDAVNWRITGNDMDMSGAIDVSAPGSTASAEVFGLPPGEESYVVMLTAESTDEQVACQGSAEFGVQAVDQEGDPIMFSWTGTGGSIADANACTTCASPPCVCTGGACIPGCNVPAPVNFAIDPVIALDTAFLEAAAQTLCDLGTLLTQADVTAAQVSIDAVAGATCTEQLSELTPVPATVSVATSCDGNCGDLGVTCTVATGISLPLPAVTLPCTAGSAGSEVQICSTGEVPLAISLSVPPPPPAYQETFVGVQVGGGAITVAFACNTSSTTAPAPGTSVSCTAPNPTGACAALPPGNVGETPFPVSDCDFGDGFPGECTTVPVGVDPSTVCPTFTVE
jgi:hypothetical protein